MSTFKYEKGKQYLMPVTFGPSVSPRQNQYGERFDASNPIRQELHTVVYESNFDQLEAIVPPGFTVRAPYVIVNFIALTNIMWLAGKGYDILNVYIPVVYKGEKQEYQGLYNAVMWEGHPDPLITGRDQIAMNKLVGEVNWFKRSGDVIKASIETWDFIFAEMDQFPEEALDEASVKEMLSLVANPDDLGIFNYRYIPNPDVPDESEIEYATFTPTVVRGDITWNPPADYDPDKVKKVPPIFCKGSIRWNKGTWEQLPTTWRVVNTLADLEVKRVVGSAITVGYSANDFIVTKRLTDNPGYKFR